MNRLVISLCLGLVAVVGAARADAAISPQLAVCSVRYEPSTSYGSYGGVVVSLHNNHAGCATGSVVQTTYFCSKQGTHTSHCTTNTAYHYSEFGIQGIYQAATQALVNERFVEVFYDSSTAKGQQLRLY